jgi:hypothetical protein
MPPQLVGGAQINPGLQQASQNALADIQTTAGRSSIQGGDVDGPLSGVAIQKLQNKGDTVSIKYFKAQEVAVCHTGRILINAIPKVYDSTKQVRILSEDGSFDMQTINKQVVDTDTGKIVKINDLSQGKYDVTCDVGPAFKNRQQESVKALQELSAVIPGLAELSADIQMKNIAAPGVDLAAERVRRKLFQAGEIPESQMTKEEMEEMQAAQLAAQQNPPEKSPADKIADAEIAKTEAQTADVISKAKERERDSLLKEQQMLFDQFKLAQNNEMQEMQMVIDRQESALEARIKGEQMMVDNLNTQADTLKKLVEVLGADGLIGPDTMKAAINQAEIITEDQESID